MPYRRLNTLDGACACDKTVPSTVIYYFYSFIYRIKYYERSRYIIKNVRFLWSSAFHPPLLFLKPVQPVPPFHVCLFFHSLVESRFKHKNFNSLTTTPLTTQAFYNIIISFIIDRANPPASRYTSWTPFQYELWKISCKLSDTPFSQFPSWWTRYYSCM